MIQYIFLNTNKFHLTLGETRETEEAEYDPRSRKTAT